MTQRVIKYKILEEFPKYEIGDDGSVFSLDYNHRHERKILRQYTNQDGYSYVFLVVNNRRYKRLVHRLVAISFIPNPENKPQVNHKDGVRNNNDVSNLEWNTSQENTIHGWRVNGRQTSGKAIESCGRRFRGGNNPKAKLNEAQVLSIKRLRAKGLLYKDIAARIGNISIAQVGAIARGKFWNATTPELVDPKMIER